MLPFEARRSETPKPHYVRVPMIEGAGEYRFSSDPNQEIRREESKLSDSLPGEHGYFLNDLIEAHLKESFPTLLSRRIYDATVINGKYIPPRLSEPSEWHPGYPALLLVNNENYFYDETETYTNTGGHWTLHLSDVGNPSVIDNRLVSPKDKIRNGSLSLMTSGSAHQSFRNEEKNWRGILRIAGDNPGTLITATIDYINIVNQERSIPLWKKL